MDTQRAWQIERLTRAAHGAAPERDSPTNAPRRTRLLPGPGALVVLVLVVVLVGGISVMRHLGGGSDAGSGVAGGAPSSSVEEDGSTESGFTGAAPQSGGSLGSLSTAAETPSAWRDLVVYVTGHVAEPGVVELASGSRVRDAVDRVGGLLPDADLESINLARVLEDGEHITVWAAGEAPTAAFGGGSGSGGGTTGASGSGSGTSGSGCVDLNTADATTLDGLDGVGPALAQRILDYRAQVGRITSVDQLDDVPGIGAALIQRVSPGVCS